jgi:GNAT superfamily N-acetyltransferase
MNIRDATPADKELILELVREFEASLPPLPYPEDTPEEDWERISKRIREGVVLVADDDEGAVGFVDAKFAKGHVFVVSLFVRERARRSGVGSQLLERVSQATRARGLTHMELWVEARNSDAIRFYERLGFREGAKVLRVALDELRAAPGETGESLGAVHVQSDDAEGVERTVAQYLPRLAREASFSVDGGRGWTAVRVEPFSLDVLRKLGAELSFRFAVSVVLTLEQDAVVRFVVHDQGRVVDEYLSVPEFYGALPPGDALALRANPTVVARLTGADPARVRAVARTADAPSQLPPARELYEQLAGVLGLAP